MIDKISNEWSLLGFTCDLWVDPPGKHWENNVHEVDQLFMLLEGEIELEIAGKISKPKINEVVLIPAQTKHSVRNIGHKETRWLYGYKMKNANTASMDHFNE